MEKMESLYLAVDKRFVHRNEGKFPSLVYNVRVLTTIKSILFSLDLSQCMSWWSLEVHKREM